jgi:hypothetical protein
LIVKKKHYFGVTTNGEIKYLEWKARKMIDLMTDKAFDQYFEDFKAGADRTEAFFVKPLDFSCFLN